MFDIVENESNCVARERNNYKAVFLFDNNLFIYKNSSVDEKSSTNWRK